MKELFVSTDIEADGPIPGPHSMLSLGSAVFAVDDHLGAEIVDKFSVNLDVLPGASQHPETMDFWRQHPVAWAASRTEMIPPQEAMRGYLNWLKGLPCQVVFTAWPATYDFMFVYWYLMNFTGESPFKWSGLDVKSYFMGMSRERSWLQTSMSQLPQEWIPNNPEPHIALNDAIEQGWIFCNMYVANLRRK